MVSETASNVCAFLAIGLASARQSLAPPPGARHFLERIIKLYLSFINMTKLNLLFGDMKDAVLLYRYSRLTRDDGDMPSLSL